MVDQSLLEKLSALTGSLTPGEGVSVDDLQEVRRLLALSLVSGTGDPPRAPTLEETHELATFAAELEDLTASEVEELNQALSDAQRVRAAVDSGERPAEDLEVRVYRRELPIFTSQAESSMAAWAAGRRVDRTIGPFNDTLGRPYWFDIFVPVQQVSVVRQPSTTPFLQIPLAGFVYGGASRYKLPAGSIWIRSRALTSTAPAGAYTGLRIQGGDLILDTPATASGGTLQVAATATVTLAIELYPQLAGAFSTGPGVDAAESEARPPAAAIFTFTPSGGEVTEATEATARIYGNELTLTWIAAAPEYEPLVNRIMVPYQTASELEIDGARSQLFQPRGQTAISAAAWALPVTVATPASLGEAAGAGALAVFTEDGLRATWRGLEGPPVRLGTLFLVEPGRLVVVAAKSHGRGCRQRLCLWQGATGRRSVVEVSYRHAFTLRFFSEQGASEAFLVGGALTASLDRPLASNGRRLPARSDTALLGLIHDGSGFSCLLAASLDPPADPISLALSNALLKSSPPLGLLLYGRLSATEPESVEEGATLLLFDLRLFVPFLPDPYAANFAMSRATHDTDPTHFTRVADISPASALFALTLWSEPDQPRLLLHLIGLPRGLPTSTAPAAPPSHDLVKQDRARLKDLRDLFDRTAGGGQEQVKLLDLSTYADHFGVGFGVPARALLDPTHASAGGNAAILQFKGVDWVSAGRNMRVFTTPQIQWEPVITADPNPGGFPSPMASAGDGGPTLIGANSVTLAPVAPRPLLTQIVEEFNREPGSRPAAALFTLPFGMVAAARLEKPATAADKGARLSFNRPATPDGAFKGGLQVAMQAVTPNVGPGYESASFEGAVVQTRNGIDPNTLAVLGKSVLSGLPGSAPGTAVEDIFNNEMEPGSSASRVPVTRIDISGYGASTFSDWYNPKAKVAETSQVRFDVMVGRTAYEVVQVKSILYPWAVPVIRTVTIERRREGLVFRKDSGWVAIAEGRYSYPSPVAIPSGWGNQVTTHPGVVTAACEVRRIRETGRAYRKTIAGKKVVLSEVRFDADFEIDGVVTGRNSDGRVPSIDQVGFIQAEPRGLPLYDVAFARLLADEGPLGGPVDCVVDVGGSGQTMRIARVDVGPAPNGFSGYEFAAAARGALDLPNDGAWSVLRHDFSRAEPTAVDLDSGTPLVRRGKAGTVPSDWFRVADPEDLLTGGNPAAEYALMQSSNAHRVLFPRPRIQKGGSAVESSERAVLADAFAMAGASGLFPDRKVCFDSAAPFKLDIRGDGRYKLSPPTLGFPVPAAQEVRDMANAASFKIYAKYPVGDPSQITFTLDPDAAAAWKVRERKLSIGMDLGPFPALMTFKGEFYVEEGADAKMLDPELVYGTALGPVNAVIQLLTKIAALLGVNTPFGFSMTNPEPRMKAAVGIDVAMLAHKVFDLEIDADGFVELWRTGPWIKGSIGAGMSNDPGVLSKTQGLTTTDTGELSVPYWTGYFTGSLGIRVPIKWPLFGDGLATFTLVGNELTSYFVEIRLEWGASAPINLGALKVMGRLYFGIIVEAGGHLFGIGILIGVSGSARVLKGMFAITVKFEVIGLIETSINKEGDRVTEAIGRARVAAEITVCWFITVSFSAEVEAREQISA